MTRLTHPCEDALPIDSLVKERDVRLLPEELAVCHRREWPSTVFAVVGDVRVRLLQDDGVGVLQALEHGFPASRGGIGSVVSPEAAGLAGELLIIARRSVVVEIAVRHMSTSKQALE
jgi:hypothetical protein